MVKKQNYKRFDWVKLQEEFDLYKATNREKTLKDFCQLKKLNYGNAYKKLKCKKSAEKVKIFDRAKNASFVKNIEKQAEILGEIEAMTYTEKIGMLDEIITLVDDFIEEVKAKGKKPFKTITEATKVASIAIKSQVELMKIEIDKRIQAESASKDLISEENNFFDELLNAKIKDVIADSESQ